MNTVELKLQRGVIPAGQKVEILADHQAGAPVEDLMRKYGRSKKVLLKFLEQQQNQPLSPSAARVLRLVVEVPLQDHEIKIPMGISVPLALPVGLDATNTTAFLQQIKHLMESLAAPSATVEAPLTPLEEALHASPPLVTEGSLQGRIAAYKEGKAK